MLVYLKKYIDFVVYSFLYTLIDDDDLAKNYVAF